MPVSTRRSVSYPAGTDAPNLPTHFANLIAALDLDTPFYSGTLAARPAFNAAGHYAGEWYWATDTQ